MMTRRRVRHRLSRWSSQGWLLVAAMALMTGCGEPVFENAGSPNSLLEDREACAMELEKSPAAIAYRQNPTAHPEYVSQVFEDVNCCIEHKGWKQVRSQQEQEQVNQAITSELAQTASPHRFQIPRPEKPWHGRSKIDWRVYQAQRVDEKF